MFLLQKVQSVRLEKEIEFILVCYHMQLTLHILPRHMNLEVEISIL